MSEIKAAIFSMAVFVLIIFPALIFVGIESLHQHSFMKHTTELTEIVRQEGGVTGRVQQIESKLEARGYEIDFGGVTGRAAYGTNVNITFRYTYDTPLKVWGMGPTRTLTTVNTVYNMRR